MTFFSFQGSGQTSTGQTSRAASGCPSWLDVPHLREVHERLLDHLGQLLWTWRTSGSPLRASQMSEPPLRLRPGTLRRKLTSTTCAHALVLSTGPELCLHPLLSEKLRLSFYSLLTPFSSLPWTLRCWSSSAPHSVPSPSQGVGIPPFFPGMREQSCPGGSSQRRTAAHREDDNKNAHTQLP